MPQFGTPESVGDARIGSICVSGGPRVAEKLEKIGTYIAEEASETGVDITEVPMPSYEDWRQLTRGGRSARLPFRDALVLCATPEMVDAATKRGVDILLIWFEAGLEDLQARRAKAAQEAARRR